MGKKRTKSIRFHVPFTATAPAMTSASVGIAKLMERRSREATADVTLIDAPDNRLLRAGVIVAHRVADGLGEWSLEAPSWSPRLPSRRVEPIGASADLPDDFGRVIRPIARGATLGPVAALTIRHQLYALEGSGGVPLAEIRDEMVTIRRGGVATARYREVTVQPAPAMTPQQVAFVIDSMASVSATPVHRFPTLQQRLGPPATGLTDFPEPQPVAKDATMEDLVTSVFAGDLQDLVDAMIDFELGRPDDVAIVNAQLQVVMWDIRGLAHVLEPSWREGIESLLADLPFSNRTDAVTAGLQVAESLVGAVHAPRLGDVSNDAAGPLLLRRAEQGLYILADRCRSLDVDSPDPQWEAALKAAEQLTLSAGVAAVLPSRPVARTLRLLDGLSGSLRACVAPPEVVDLDGLGVQEAFELGRDVERRRLGVTRAREKFVADWPDLLAKLRKLQKKAKKK